MLHYFSTSLLLLSPCPYHLNLLKTIFIEIFYTASYYNVRVL